MRLRNYILTAIFFVMFAQEIYTADEVFISMFGDRIITDRNDATLIMYQYNVSSADVSSATTNSGTVQSVASLAEICTGSNTTASAQIQSNRTLPYLAGHEGSVFFTAAFTGGAVANSTQWIGIFDDLNGVAIGFNGVTFSVLQRRNGVDTSIGRTNFNGDPLDGSGASGFTLNSATLNVFRIAYGWLGASILNFQIQDEDGNWITFHTIRWPNSSTTPSIFNPVLPMRARVAKTGAGAQNLCMRTGSWNAAVGALQSRPNSRFFAFDVVTAIALTLETYIMTIRPRATFHGIPNTIMLRLSAWSIASPVTTSRPLILRLYKNSTILVTNFVDVDTANSVAEVDTLGLLTLGTGTLILSVPTNVGSASFMSFINRSDYVILVEPGNSITITAQPLTGLATNTFFALSWEELF